MAKTIETGALPETVAAGDVIAGVQLCPFGEYPNGATVQKCDAAAFRRIVADWWERGAHEILMDFEHLSESADPNSDTAAAAWISNLIMDEERGLVGDLKLTDLGAEAVSNRRLRFLSPVWTLDAEGRPDRLISVALTNKPNIPVACVLNRAPSPGTSTVEGQKETIMDKIKELLGLSPEATDDETLAAVAALKEQVAAANKEKEEAEAESFADKHQAVCNCETLKKAYLLNREAAQALVAGLVKPAQPKQKLLNRAEGARPAEPPRTADPRAEMAALAPSQRAAFYQAHKAEF